MDISINTLSDAFGYPIVADTESGSVTVSSSDDVIPEPSTIALISIGVLEIIIGYGWRRHRKNGSK